MAARILMVEDEADAARDLRATAEKLGYVVAASADNGDDACRLAGEHSPDVVLMDIQLRGSMNGLEAAHIIDERYHIPVIVVTKHINDDRIRDANQASVDAVLRKPVLPDNLRAAIEVALHRQTRRGHMTREQAQGDKRRDSLREWSRQIMARGPVTDDVNTVSVDFLRHVVDGLQPRVATLYQPVGDGMAAVAALVRDAAGSAQVLLADSPAAPGSQVEKILQRAAREQTPVIDDDIIAVPLLQRDTLFAILCLQADAGQLGIERWQRDAVDFGEVGGRLLCDARLNSDIDDHLEMLWALAQHEGAPEAEVQSETDTPGPPAQ